MILPKDARLMIVSIKFGIADFNGLDKDWAAEVEYHISSTVEMSKGKTLKPLYAGVLTFPLNTPKAFGIQLSEENEGSINKIWDAIYAMKPELEKLILDVHKNEFTIGDK